MSTVTLLGEHLAEAGTEFVYGGESAACAGCPYRDQCLNLTEGRRYRVTRTRDSGTLECAVHATGVTAVEVEPAPVLANVASNASYVGSKTALEGPCPYTECPSYEYCVPDGVEFDREYQIADVVGDPPHDHCMLDRDLTLVEFSPPSEPGR